MGLKIGKDTKSITIIKEVNVLTNSTIIRKGTFGDSPEDIKEIVIPEGVTCIEENAFEGCVDLISITLPASLKHIRRNAFIDCKKLKNVVLPESISEIECWGERRAWKISLVKPYSDLVKHLIDGLEVELDPPFNWE
jgi:hypothetical protein